jgi:hypothetical protein
LKGREGGRKRERGECGVFKMATLTLIVWNSIAQIITLPHLPQVDTTVLSLIYKKLLGTAIDISWAD